MTGLWAFIEPNDHGHLEDTELCTSILSGGGVHTHTIDLKGYRVMGIHCIIASPHIRLRDILLPHHNERHSIVWYQLFGLTPSHYLIEMTKQWLLIYVSGFCLVVWCLCSWNKFVYTGIWEYITSSSWLYILVVTSIQIKIDITTIFMICVNVWYFSILQ